MSKAIMIQGTASGVGKTVLAAGLCRLFAEDGYRVAPFKALNISTLSHTLESGLLMSTAQAMQAEAARKQADVRMNPLLLNPCQGEGGTLYLHGVARPDLSPSKLALHRVFLQAEIRKAYESLAAENDMLVIEGAGSPAEINLQETDLANMSVAEMAGAPVLLVGDISKGGAFAALYGTVLLQPPHLRPYIQGTIINKFFGNPTLLRPGPQMLESLLGIPCVGVIPHMDIQLEEEDTPCGSSSPVANDLGGLAKALRPHLDMSKIYTILRKGIPL